MRGRVCVRCAERDVAWWLPGLDGGPSSGWYRAFPGDGKNTLELDSDDGVTLENALKSSDLCT